MRTKKIRAFRPAREVLEAVLDRLKLTQSVREHRVFEIWDAAVGPQVAAHARPQSIAKGVLRVRVDHNTWLQQLTYMKSVLLDKLNAQLGEGTLADLDLRLGKIAPRVNPSRERSGR
ncbi:MAG: DUF721 domain-containing protein [Deltaproteobacteria bacterium]|nr:DUF721 domain-containing protein [Deltaproteobacteria bacterium]